MVSYDSVLSAPEVTLRNVFEWIGDGDVEAAIQEVQPTLRTQDEQSDDDASVGDLGLEAQVVETFDALYDLVLEQRPLEQAFVDRLNETNETLSDRIQKAVKEVVQGQLERRQLLQERRRRAGQGPKGGKDTADT